MLKRSLFSSLLILTFLSTATTAQTDRQWMDNEQMGILIEEEAGNIEGNTGAWQLIYAGHPLMVITDEGANRMRIFSPVIAEKEISTDQYVKMLEANFHSALDAKYSVYEGYVISVFTHPLKELTPEQLIDAMRQVVSLSETFGTTYQSTGFIFAPGGQNEEEKKLNKKPSGKS